MKPRDQQYNFDKNSITVLVCAHSNSALHDLLLEMALESLCNQTYKDFKVLLVSDSCIRPETHLVFERYKRLLGMKVIAHVKSGLADAKNFGLKTDDKSRYH